MGTRPYATEFSDRLLGSIHQATDDTSTVYDITPPTSSANAPDYDNGGDVASTAL
jgi:hypothetical protein